MKIKRLDLWLAENHPHLSRSSYQALIQKGAILVNGRPEKKRYFVADGDTIEIKPHEPENQGAPLPEKIPLAILFEDDDILIIDKPVGLVVHPGAGNWSGTFANALLYHCANLAAGNPLRPGIVHRLDKMTSGLLLAAKTESSHRHLSQQFANRQVKKSYLALTCCRPAGLRAEFPIARDRHHRKRMAVSPLGRSASTDLRIVQQVEKSCLIEAIPLTGRTHQIRLHLSALGSPIAGDLLYGGRAPAHIDLEHPLLHAWKLGFTHPKTSKAMHFCAPLTPHFASILSRLRFDELFF